MAIQKAEIKLKVNGKTHNTYLATPDGGGPGVMVLPSWWGLKPYFKLMCDRLAGQGYTALALDYYDGQVGTTIYETKVLQASVESDPEILGGMVKAAKDHLTSLGKGQSIAMLGFSMGADWSLLTAAKEPDVAATVLFYGHWSPDFSKMKSKVQGHFADADEWQPLDGVRETEQNMKAAKVDVTFYVYPGTAHWFMEEDRPEYNPAAAALAWERTLQFLKQELR